MDQHSVMSPASSLHILFFHKMPTNLVNLQEDAHSSRQLSIVSGNPNCPSGSFEVIEDALIK